MTKAFVAAAAACAALLATSGAYAAAAGVAGARATTAGAGITHIKAKVGDTVHGARGTELGTVAGSDREGNLVLSTEEGKVTLSSGLLSYRDGELSAPTTSSADLEDMAETQSE